MSARLRPDAGGWNGDTILRHADFKVTMEIYTQVSSKQARDALKRLSDSLDGS